MTKFTPVKMPKYRGENRFLKALLQSGTDHMVYFGLDEFDRHRIFITENKESIVIDFNILAGLELAEINNKQIELYLIAVNQDIRQNGLGTNLLNHLIYIATECEFEIVLTPSNVFNTNKVADRIGMIAHTKKNKIKVSDLSRWYKKHGFVNYNKDDQGKQRLIFRPSLT